MSNSQPQKFSVQKSIVYTTTTMNDKGIPETKIYRSGYAETNTNSIHKYYILAEDGEFKETTEQAFLNIKLCQDNMISSSTLVDHAIDPPDKLFLPQTSPCLPLHEETEISKLRRENREMKQVMHK